MKPITTTPLVKPDLPPSHITIYSPFTPRVHSCCQCGNTEHELVFVRGEIITFCPHRHDPRACIASHSDEAHGCQVLDHLGKSSLKLRTPTVFLCSTCNAEHSVHEIMTQTVVTCGCGAPYLDAVYDQFGTILLWLRCDPTVDDLTDPKKVAEARQKLLEVGAVTWIEHEASLREYFEAQGSPKFLHEVDLIKRAMMRPKDTRRELGIQIEVLPSPSLSPSTSPSPPPSESPSDDLKSLEKAKMPLKGTAFEIFTASQMKEISSAKHRRGWSQVSGMSVETENSFDAELASLGVMDYSR